MKNVFSEPHVTSLETARSHIAGNSVESPIKIEDSEDIEELYFVSTEDNYDRSTRSQVPQELTTTQSSPYIGSSKFQV